MKRRSFLKAAVAALFAPAALVKAKETPKVVVVDDRFRPPPPGTLGYDDLYISPEAMNELLHWVRDERLRDNYERAVEELYGEDNEPEFVPYIIPLYGRIPEKTIVGDPMPFDWAVLDNRRIPLDAMDNNDEYGCAILDDRRVLLAEFE